tara:strand:- start:565 stop:1164 length:600 start_codon:yes stop_codon:yes gene_type:complete
MQNNLNEIEELINLISKFPGLGKKSAKRIALKLINNKEALVKPLAKVLGQVYKNVVRCKSCGNFKNEDKPCVCLAKNKSKKICVVENIADMWVIEQTGIFDGGYHILGGTLSNNNREDQLLIPSLINRVKNESINELILATSATVEGQTTAHYIQNVLKDTNVKISKLAQGLPIGSEIEFLDDGTLFSAFKNRSLINTS